MLTGQPWENEPQLGYPVVLPARGDRAGAALSHRLELEVECDAGRVRTRALLADSVLSERDERVPFGVGEVWRSLSPSPELAEARLADAGERLREALLDETAVQALTALIDGTPLGTVVDVVIVADGAALALPFELLRLADGRLLATVPGVRMRRRVTGLERTAGAPLPGPLKILVAVGAPEASGTDNPPLDIEAEMQAVLDALAGADGVDVGQVRILEVASPEQIAQGLAEDQYHVLHLSAHGSSMGIELEDEDGRPVAVDADELVRVLRSGERPLPLIVLSSCAGAASGADGLAATLVRHGADRVLAMQAPVSDRYATLLAGELYSRLSNPAGVPVAAALAAARMRLEEQAREEASTGCHGLEYAIPALFCVEEDPPLLDLRSAAQPLERATPLLPSGGVRRLPVGYLIGRRRELRSALTALRSGIDEAGSAVSGVMLTGVGGIGKTALAGRIESRLASESWLPAVHFGRWNPTELTRAVAEAITGVAALAEARAALLHAEIDDATKLRVVCQLLRDARVVLFDDFEQNLYLLGETVTFIDPGFAEVFDQLCAATGAGRLLITSRYQLPDADAFLLDVPVPPLSHAELRRLLWRLPALRELEAEDRRVLIGTIGGHPRLLEFVNALLQKGGRATARDATVKLRTLAREHGVSLASSRPLSQAIPEAVLLGSRDILLEPLVASLTDDERELLLQAAVSTVPMTVDDLAVARWEAAANEHETAVVAATERLIDLTLLATVDGNEITVLPWVAETLAAHQGGDVIVRHRRAAAMRLARINAGRGRFGEIIETARHFTAAGEVEQFVQFTYEASVRLAADDGALSVAAFLGELLPAVPTSHPNFLPLADREIAALLNTGRLSAARNRADAMLRIAEGRCQANPDDVPAQRDLSVMHNRLGGLAIEADDRVAAERHYGASLIIRQQLASDDPDSVRAQRDLSVIYTNLGDLSRRYDDMEAAERHYRNDLSIVERLSRTIPPTESSSATS